jgi:hypothetical protein
MGRIGLSICTAQPNVVYATIETTDGPQIYLSTDFAASWARRGDNYSYPWYMGQVRADPVQPGRVYFLGLGVEVSDDSGAHYKSTMPGHSDQHALWIDPKNPRHLISGNDGGLYISFDGGVNTHHVKALPISQFYAIGVDNREPYHVYGGTQDNSSWGAPNATRSGGPASADWYITTGGDGFYTVPDPNDPNTVYSESQNGGLVRYDVATGRSKGIAPDPETGDKSFRFNWSAPILISPHDSKTVYFGGNFLFKSTDRGDSWVKLGGDHTRQRNSDSMPLMGKIWPKNSVAYHQGVAE